jgi:ferredoxin
MHVVARVADEGDALVVSRHVASRGREQELGRVDLAVQVRRADRTCPVDALEVGLGDAEVADPGRVGTMSQRRAIGRDVVRDELPEERPHRRDIGVGVIGDAGAEVARSTRTAELMKPLLVNVQRGHVFEQRAVTAAVDGRVDAFRRQAVISGDTPGVLGTRVHGSSSLAWRVDLQVDRGVPITPRTRCKKR